MSGVDLADGTSVRKGAGSAIGAWLGHEPQEVRDTVDAIAREGGTPLVVGRKDAAGTGTTLYAAPYDDFDPHFGPGSRAAHLAFGAVEVPGEMATLRQDVDDVGDLGRAMVLGVGRHTADAMRHGVI